MNKKLYKLMNWGEIEGIVYSDERDPYRVLGKRSVGANTLIAAFIPDADEVNVVLKQGREEKTCPMELADENGFYACLIPGKVAGYELSYKKGKENKRIKDSYAFTGYEIKGSDAKKLAAFEHLNLYDVLGANVMTVKGTDGVRFALYAPSALSVSVAGDFNGFDNRMHPMKLNEELGIFELFIPGAKAGDNYIYNVKIKGGESINKLDPFAKQINLTENTSVITDKSSYAFMDAQWLKSRKRYKQKSCPLSIYELSLQDFKSDKKDGEYLSYKEITKELIPFIKKAGYTHIALLPLGEYLSDESLGFKTLSFYAPSDRFGTPDELCAFIEELHKNDIGVIFNIDLSSFERDELGLSAFDGSFMFESADGRLSYHPGDDRLMFDLSKPFVREFLTGSVLYWVQTFHADGIKLNGLSSMLYLNYQKNENDPVLNMYGGYENIDATEFIRSLNTLMRQHNKDVLLLAEEETGFPYVTLNEDEGLLFDYKLNNGLTGDILAFICDDMSTRQRNFNMLSESMAYRYSESFINALSCIEFMYQRPSMLERLPGSDEEKKANLRLVLSYMMTYPGKKLMYKGQDDGGLEDIASYVSDINALYKNNPALFELDDEPEGFEWINSMPSDKCILSFLRKGSLKDDVLLCVFNFSPYEQSVKVGTPLAGKYKELLNTDNKDYGGSGNVNTRAKAVMEDGADGREYSIELKMAPLSAGIYRYLPFTEKEKYRIAKKKEAALANTRAEEYAREAAEAEQYAASARAEMEDAKKRMKDAEARAKKARDMEKEELMHAKEALKEAGA